MSSNFKINLFYGKEINLVNSDYYLIVDKSKEYQVIDNKIYVGEIVEELSKYSFVEIGRNLNGYRVGKVNIDNEYYSCFEKEVLKDYKGEIKKYLSRNKEKFNDLKIVSKVIDLL